MSRKRRAVADAAFDILTEARVLHRDELLERIVAQGLQVAKNPGDPVDALLRILRADKRFMPANSRPGNWMLTKEARNRPNDLHYDVQLNCENHTQNETAEGSLPSTASTKREDESQMVTINATTQSQAENGRNPDLIRIATALEASDPDDGEIGRQQRGMAIAATVRITKGKLGYMVPSQSGQGKYVVNLDDEDSPYCTCDDFAIRNRPCKHIYAALFTIIREEGGAAELPSVWVNGHKGAESEPVAREPVDEPVPEPEPVAEKQAKKEKGRKQAETEMLEMPTLEPIPPKPVTNSKDGRNHPAINKAMDLEPDVFPVMLRELCDTIEEPERAGAGRPSLSLADMVFAATAKTFGLKSARTSGKTLREAVSNGQMEQEPCFSSVMRYLNKPELTPILVHLIEQSAVPLAELEAHFSPDSSGFGTSVYDEWFEEKHGSPVKRSKQDRQGRHGKYITAHIFTGAKTGIVAAVLVTAENSPDCPQLPKFIETAKKHFHLKEISADKAYLADYNLRAVYEVGAVPFIPYKKNSTPNKTHHKRDPLWTLFYHFFHNHRDLFLRYYHQRSNVEAAFSTIKRKYLGYVRTKNPIAQVNEVLTKILCYNLFVLTKAMVSGDITTDWTPAVQQLGLLD